ncbi:hypothetical protein [Frankia sp. AiPa1]|uniref:MmyB family transcriptional regulator n=1 Tax=Frankia sp. AiPa1 TaxID=573492 RepID=UPI0035A90921
MGAPQPGPRVGPPRHTRPPAGRRGRRVAGGGSAAASEEVAGRWAEHEVRVRRADHKRIIHDTLDDLGLDTVDLALDYDGQRRPQRSCWP